MDKRIQFVIDTIDIKHYEDGEVNPFNKEYNGLWNDELLPAYKQDILVELLSLFFEELDTYDHVKNQFINLINESTIK